ncbi:MAG: hypothetical protein IKF39_04650 [Oscillospiraceae bacterium]|nr:hypothetical protein [Oscillospiraceae bacterium]
MISYKVKIGIAPCRRNMPGFGGRGSKGIWSAGAAYDMMDVCMPYIKEHFGNEHVEFVDLEGVTDDGMMYEYAQAEGIAEFFRSQKIDALFIANINFGCEEVGGKLGQLLNLPTLIWSPQEEHFGVEGVERDIRNSKYGERLLDGQCGLFALSKLLQRYHVTFTEIPTCKVDSEVFAKYFTDFAAVTCMLKNWKHMRVMQLGNRPLAFTSMMVNEDELMERFGIEIFPMSVTEASDKVRKIRQEREDELQPIVDEFLSYFPVRDEDLRDSDTLKNGAAALLFYREMFRTTGCSVIAVDNSFMNSLGSTGMMDMQMAANEGLPVMFEGDILGGITEVLMSSAVFGEKLPFFGEFTANHPTNPNAELIWHTAVFPPSIAGNRNFEPYIIKGHFGAQSGLEVRPGTYTIGRLDGMNGKYSMIMGNFRSTEGPFTKQHYIWGEFKDWQKFEQAVMYGPYVHHMIEIEGGEEVVRRMKEFCRYAGIYADVPDERDTPFAPYYY